MMIYLRENSKSEIRKEVNMLLDIKSRSFLLCVMCGMLVIFNQQNNRILDKLGREVGAISLKHDLFSKKAFQCVIVGYHKLEM